MSQLSENVNFKIAILSFGISLTTFFNQQMLYDFELATYPCSKKANLD